MVLSFCMIQCTHQYGLEYNKERIKKGIPIIEDNFILKNHFRKDVMGWGLPGSLDEMRTYHYFKGIRLNSDASKILFEDDLFHTRINDSLSYRLFLTYNYQNENHWECELLHDIRKPSYREIKDSVSLIQADSILSSWGLSRKPNW